MPWARGEGSEGAAFVGHWCAAFAALSTMMTTELKIVRSLISLFKSHRLVVAASVVLGILSSFAEGVGIALFIPFVQMFTITAPAVEEGASPLIRFLGELFASVPSDRRVLVICMGILGAVLAKVVLYYLHGLLLMYLDWKIGHQIRSGLANQILSVSFRYVERRDSGDLLNTLSTESWNATDALSVILDIMITACTLLVYIVLLLLISPKLTVLALVAMLVISLTVRFLTRHVKTLGANVTKENAALATRMLETVEGNKVIRTFGREKYEQTRFDDISQNLGRLCCKLGSVKALVSPVYELCSAALLVCILFTSAQDPATLGSALVFMFALYRVQPIMAGLDGARVSIRSQAASIDAVTSLLTSADKPYLAPGATPFVGMTHEICFDRASFKYNADDKFSIQDLCVRFTARKTTALVGPSGSGKSTLIKLILRLYDVEKGEILVDGLPLRALDLPSWREKIAVVSQDVYVFNATIRDNIAYGRLDATDADIVAAAKQANAHDFIADLPQGYLTNVGDRGVRLSGGQLQRLTLARAIVRDPDILILDEATNSLDSISEHLIQEALEKFARLRTVIIIAHRFSTIEQADHIIVLEEGRVREQGSLDSLLDRGGLFSQLYTLQGHNRPSRPAART
jgi:subfamily B ATP-binding cassette protein MsbA